MGAPIGRRQSGPRTASPRRELALDLTRDEIVLHEGSAEAGWRRFAGVALDDPEFLEVIGLLRAEAEAALGGAAPVRLWLPAEQVLVLSMAIDETDPEARLAAAFARIGETTGHAPDEVALAVAPAGRGTGGGGSATVLAAYAETLAEARDYAARWGFRPGPVSTRHHAADFAPAEPVFRLRDPRETARTPGPDSRRADSRAASGVAPRIAPRIATVIATLAWALTAAPAEADAAPGRTPIPAARTGESAAAPSPAPAPDPALSAAAPAPAGDASRLAFLPPPRPEPAPEPADAAVWKVAPSGPGERARSGGAAAPLPPTRPGSAGVAAPASESPASDSPTPERPASAPPAPDPGVAAPAAPADPPAVAAAPRPPVRTAERGLVAGKAALIGILNLESGREALLRLPDGGFVRVSVGDVLDGWRVSAIGRDAMRVSRGTRELTLLLVSR